VTDHAIPYHVSSTLNSPTVHLPRLFLVVLLLALSPRAIAVPNDTWLLVDTDALTLTVMKGDRPQFTFFDIAIGRYGTTQDKHKGDHKTPLGRFRIAWIKDDSRFHRFLGLEYPRVENARRAYQNGEISREDWQAIRRAIEAGRVPPQDTALGGYIGIHGLGVGDIKLHRQYNWTSGCVALTNEEIDRLLKWVGLGTPVEIR
jgi:murein L,D-transpeptidase YafK